MYAGGGAVIPRFQDISPNLKIDASGLGSGNTDDTASGGSVYILLGGGTLAWGRNHSLCRRRGGRQLKPKRLRRAYCNYCQHGKLQRFPAGMGAFF